MRLIVTLALVVAAGEPGSAQVPVGQEPHHRVVFEDAHLRVLDVVIPPGTTTLEHSHDHDIATVSIGPADARIRPMGGDWGAARRRPLGDTNTAEYVGKQGIHTIQNVSADPYRLIAVENVKQSGWRPTPAAAAPNVLALVEGRAFRASALRLDADTRAPRLHAGPSVVVLVSGEALLAAAGREPLRLSAASRWGVVPAGQAFTVSVAAGRAQLVEIEVF